jgi:uncharacterized protein YoxC
MDAGQLAALIAAGFFALLACVAIYVLIRFARLMSAATRMLTGYRERADQLIEQAQSAVDRTNEQLVRTDAITSSMDQVTANMAELSGHVSALAGLARGISTAATAPVTGFAAFAFGLRRAVAVRRSLEAAADGIAAHDAVVMAERVADVEPVRGSLQPGSPAALPAGGCTARRSAPAGSPRPRRSDRGRVAQ